MQPGRVKPHRLRWTEGSITMAHPAQDMFGIVVPVSPGRWRWYHFFFIQWPRARAKRPWRLRTSTRYWFTAGDGPFHLMVGEGLLLTNGANVSRLSVLWRPIQDVDRALQRITVTHGRLDGAQQSAKGKARSSGWLCMRRDRGDYITSLTQRGRIIIRCCRSPKSDRLDDGRERWMLRQNTIHSIEGSTYNWLGAPV